jgi:sugar O-acyltransferase (sialic acid O-acetyltransferase NeuD family)
MTKRGLILIGAGGHARSCIDVIEQQGKYQIGGLVGFADQIHTRQFGYEVIASDDGLEQLAKSYQYALISIGQIRTPEHRQRLYQKVLQHGFQFPAIISPSAHVSRHATIGAGSIVMHGAVVNPGATVGVNCIVNSRALIEHDAKVGDHCHISTGAMVNGDVSVGVGSFLGSGCIVKEGVSIGKGCVVGMGLAIRHTIADGIRFTGHKEP